jgi:lipopolysaccharide/colanic/teichoic acid biosynthesis glycosyltransferase
VKRALDVVGSVIGLFVLAPLFLILAGLIKITSKGPVLFKSRRVGRFGRVFMFMKLRTMVVNADRIGGPTTSDRDPRITRVGGFLRRFKLDELPQLINVLKGEMSFVGPRPEVEAEVSTYSEEQRRILSIKPGITDYASLWNSDEGSVLVDTIDSHAAFKKYIQPTKLALQIKYFDEQNFWLDLRLIVYTIVKIVRKRWIPAVLRAYPPPVVPSEAKIHAAKRKVN